MTRSSQRTLLPTLPLATWRAGVLHPPHPTVEALQRKLERLGLSVKVAWPALEAEDTSADVVFFDADMAHDGQFPWGPGQAPMPLVALIGSEAPGRIEWALTHGANAHLLKPIGAAGVYSALLIAAHGHASARRLAAEIEALEERVRARPQVMRALLALMAGGLDEDAAIRTLRLMAMERRMTVEDMAGEIAARIGSSRRSAAV